jgi:hypothetical protein
MSKSLNNQRESATIYQNNNITKRNTHAHLSKSIDRITASKRALPNVIGLGTG